MKPVRMTVFGLLSAALALSLLPVTNSQAQDAPPSPQPAEQPAPAEKPAEPAPAAATTTEKAEPVFATRAAVIEFYQPLRGELLTKLDGMRPEAGKEAEHAKAVKALQDQLANIDRRHVQSLRAYLKAHQGAADAAVTRRDIVEFSMRFAAWDDAIAMADEYLKLHEAANSDLTREVRYMRADAFGNQAGIEDAAAAATAYRDVIKLYPASREADLSRAGLLRVLLLLDRVVEAKDLLAVIGALEAVKADELAAAWVAEEQAKLALVGTKLPAFTVTGQDDATLTELHVAGRPAVLWFWDTTSAPCLEERAAVEAVVGQWKADLRGYSISVNKSQAAWKQWLEANPGSKLTAAWQGSPSDTSLTRKLGVRAIPLCVLVNADLTVFRFDVATDDLARAVTSWMAGLKRKADSAEKPAAPRQASDADKPAAPAPAKPPDAPTERPVEKPVEKPTEQPSDKPREAPKDSRTE